MKNLTKLLIVTAMLLGFNASSIAQPKVQMAIMLDASGSMNGLIDQARSQIWKIVNELMKAKKNGETPSLEVALYEYGKTNLLVEEGHMQMLMGLTTDLDSLSEKLNAIATNGGDEFAGLAIQKATNGLQWSAGESDYRAIFVAGNESFAQGPVDFRASGAEALSKDILVNTIHCGIQETGIDGFWKEGAEITGGSFLNIDQNRVVRVIKTPYDAEIARLNKLLNQTYIPYGKLGQEAKDRQENEDNNSGDNIVYRGSYKSSDLYKNSSWDLVDALDEKVVKLEELQNSDLPEIMHEMSMHERYGYVNGLAEERKIIRKKIQALYKLREAYVRKKQDEANEENNDTLDKVMIETLHRQLEAKGFTFE